jgi:uncharacterized protein YdaU (DUF1376 family)
MVADWLASTAIALMTPAEEGAYFRLLCHAWSDADCCLPDDDAILAKLSRLGPQWKRSGQIIKDQFKSDDRYPGKIFNSRQQRERHNQTKRVEGARNHAQTAANQRWERLRSNAPAMPEHNPSTTPALPGAMPEVMPKDASILNTQYSAPITHKESKNTRSALKPTFDELKSFILAEGLPESDAIALFNKWEGNGWTNNGKTIKDWKATVRSWRSCGYLPSQKRHEEIHAPRINDDPSKLSGIDKVTLNNELNRAIERQRVIKASYDAHQDLRKEDREEMSRLAKIIKDCKEKLGVRI